MRKVGCFLLVLVTFQNGVSERACVKYEFKIFVNKVMEENVRATLVRDVGIFVVYRTRIYSLVSQSLQFLARIKVAETAVCTDTVSFVFFTNLFPALPLFSSM